MSVSLIKSAVSVDPGGTAGAAGSKKSKTVNNHLKNV